MHMSVGAVSHQILLLEATQAAVVGSEFLVITSPFKGRLALDEFVMTPPRCLILDALRKLIRKEVHSAPNVAQALALSRFPSANSFDKLSPRGLMVCDVVIEGSRAPEIA